MWKKINLAVSLIVGIVIFIITLRYFGLESIKIIYENINPVYLLAYVLFTVLVFVFNSWRLQVILKAYRKKVPLLTLIRQNIAGFAMAYVTPSVKLGGEPLKAYMLKKENNIRLRIGSSAVIIDKFVEIIGTVFVGIIGLVILFFIPQIPSNLKIALGVIVIISSAVLYLIYYRTIKRKGIFTSLFRILRIYKITRWKFIFKKMAAVELKMHKFFTSNKKEFLISFLLYIAYFAINIIEFKFLFLSFGINVSVIEIILTIVVIGIVNFIPVPAALGFLEISQSGLFSLLKNSAGIGLAFSLIIRLRNIIFTVIGFGIISHFSGEQLINRNGKR
jgi:hypothetical protein